jgi:hypothetical protein
VAKYHIGVNGPSACRARTRPCPLGGKSGSENHFETKSEAETFHQKNLSDEHGMLKSSRKVNELLSPIVINIPEKSDSTETFTKNLERISNEYPEQQIIDFYDTLRRGEIPKFLRSPSVTGSRAFMTSTTLNAAMQNLGIYGKVFKDTAKDIAKNVGPDGVVLDPMAGRGWAAKALREAGVQTIVTDDNSWDISSDIESMDALESLKKYGDKTTHLLISWAPHTSEIDLQLLQEVRANYPHITIINIGEPAGGCTGSDKFWDEVETFSPEHYVTYQTTVGLHDRITFCK